MEPSEGTLGAQLMEATDVLSALGKRFELGSVTGLAAKVLLLLRPV